MSEQQQLDNHQPSQFTIGFVVVWLLWHSGRVLVAQARGVLNSQQLLAFSLSSIFPSSHPNSFI